jgi:hypothetical protein
LFNIYRELAMNRKKIVKKLVSWNIPERSIDETGLFFLEPCVIVRYGTLSDNHWFQGVVSDDDGQAIDDLIAVITANGGRGYTIDHDLEILVIQ